MIPIPKMLLVQITERAHNFQDKLLYVNLLLTRYYTVKENLSENSFYCEYKKFVYIKYFPFYYLIAMQTYTHNLMSKLYCRVHEETPLFIQKLLNKTTTNRR